MVLHPPRDTLCVKLISMQAKKCYAYKRCQTSIHTGQTWDIRRGDRNIKKETTGMKKIRSHGVGVPWWRVVI